MRLPSQAWTRQDVVKETIKETNGNNASERHLPGIDWRMVCTTICNPGKELMLLKEIKGGLKCISMEAHSYKLAAQQKNDKIVWNVFCWPITAEVHNQMRE